MNLEGYVTSPTTFVGYWQCFGKSNRLSPKNIYHSPHFKATRVTTQGILISLTLFNLIVDNVVRNWLALVVEDQLVTQEGLGLLVGRCLGLFYVDYGMVVSQDPEWLQGSLNVLIVLF